MKQSLSQAEQELFEKGGNVFSDDELKKAGEAEKRWKENMDRMSAEQNPLLTSLKPGKTCAGLELKPAYGPLDIKDMKLEDIGMPGEFPYTRGNRPVHYQMEPLMYVTGIGFNSPEEAVERRNFLDGIGQRFHIGRDHDLPSHVQVIDLPTQHGLDPDDQTARGLVGDGGTSISTITDVELPYDSLDLGKTLVQPMGCSNNLIALNSLFVVYLQDVRKLDIAKTMLSIIIMFYHG